MQPESLYSRTGCRNTQLEPSFTGDDMHYYQFNIGDYQSHTSHLTELEDIAYRRMLDWLYLHEKPLPLEVEQIARLIRMRTHSESIANVLQEFFARNQSGFYHKRVVKDLKTFKEKSAKAKASAKARWASGSKGSDDDANGMRTHSEGNANQEPITINQEPITKGSKEPSGSNRLPPVPYQKIIDLYHEKTKFPRVEILSETRKKHLRARWKEPLLCDLESWANYFDYVGKNNFLNGRNDRAWKADFDFLIKPDTAIKCQEGKYDERV